MRIDKENRVRSSRRGVDPAESPVKRAWTERGSPEPRESFHPTAWERACAPFLRPPAAKPFRSRASDRYAVTETRIGQGTFSVVREAFDKESRRPLALKSSAHVPCARKGRDAMQQRLRAHLCILNERRILQRIPRHPNVVRLIDCAEEGNDVHLYLERYDAVNALEWLNVREDLLSEAEIRSVFRQMVEGVRHCHRAASVCHRDIKLQNFLVDCLGRVVLIDFGLAEVYSRRARLSYPCGSLQYACPQILLQRDYDAERADVYSLGVVLYQLFFKRNPFPGRTLKEVVASKETAPEVPDDIPCSTSALHLMLWMLAWGDDEASRPSLDQIAEHPFLDIDAMQRFSILDPSPDEVA